MFVLPLRSIRTPFPRDEGEDEGEYEGEGNGRKQADDAVVRRLPKRCSEFGCDAETMDCSRPWTSGAVAARRAEERRVEAAIEAFCRTEECSVAEREVLWWQYFARAREGRWVVY